MTDEPKVFRMIKLAGEIQTGLDRILMIVRRQERLKELQASGDRNAFRSFLESEFRTDPKFMRMCLKEIEKYKRTG